MDDKQINEFIRREKMARPSAGLTDRIMEAIMQTERKSVPLARGAWWLQAIAVAASLALTVMLGMRIGSRMASQSYDNWNINDSQIENLALYQSQDE